MATHSSILAWELPWMEEPGGPTVHGVPKSWPQLSDFTFLGSQYLVWSLAQDSYLQVRNE